MEDIKSKEEVKDESKELVLTKDEVKTYVQNNMALLMNDDFKLCLAAGFDIKESLLIVHSGFEAFSDGIKAAMEAMADSYRKKEKT